MILVIIRSYSSKNMNQKSLMKLPVAGLCILFGFAAIAQADVVDPLLSTGLVDSGASGSGRLESTQASVDFTWMEAQQTGSTVFDLTNSPMVDGAEAWYVDTYEADSITITIDFARPVVDPFILVDRMDDADFDLSQTQDVNAMVGEHTGGLTESAENIFTAPSGGDAAKGKIQLVGAYSRLVINISSASGRDVVHVALGASSIQEFTHWRWWDELQSWVYLPDGRDAIQGGWTYLPVVRE